MKRSYLLVLGALAMAASCSQDEIMYLQQGAPIEFRAVLDRQTKATSCAAFNLDGFNVTAWDDVDNSYYFEQVDFVRGSNDTYLSASNYYWPPTGNLLFYAYAPKASASNGIVRNSETSYTVTPLDETDDQIDLVFAKNSGTKTVNGDNGVELNFRHAMSQVYIKVKNTDSSVRFKVTGWKIAGVDGTATFDFDNSISNTSTAAFNSANTFDAGMWSGNDDSYADSYTKTFNSKRVSGSTTWGVLPGSSILIPQDASMATAYTNSVMNGAYIAIQYEAVATSDNTEIVAADTWGCWPVHFEWLPGFRYVYTIDLADFGYRENGTDELEPIIEKVEIKFVDVTVDTWQPDGGADINLPLSANPPYLRFHTEGGFQTLYMTKMMGSATETNIEYSLDEGETWTELLLTDSYNSNGVEFGEGYGVVTDLLLRSRGNGFHNLYSGSTNPVSLMYFKFADDDQLVDCIGSVMALTDYNDTEGELTVDGQYALLFYDCRCLRTAPRLPSKTITDYCYGSMFSGCRNLTACPKLPASTLADYCYYEMFSYCSSLTTAPVLPAMVMKDHAYNGMFESCYNLTTAPALPATTLASECYANMFEHCENLTTPPALPATTLAHGCYMSMFFASGITTAPELPATKLAKCCYMSMFDGCHALQTAPVLAATELLDSCYWRMFAYDTSLTTAPALPATTLTESCYEEMFKYCNHLSSAPALPATTLAESCYKSMFELCSALTNAPELPAMTMAESCYESMFEECDLLTTAPALPATTLASACYANMFESCNALTSAPALPATSLTYRCYDSMFRGCTSLQTAPDLPATQLTIGCYNSMFMNCSSLNSIKAMFISDPGNDCLYWFDGAGSGQSGTFYKNSAATWSNDNTNVNIPGGWTVITVSE